MKRSLPPLKLQNSPLVYVLAQVRVSAVMSIEKYVPDIQERLRHQGFPRFQRGKIQEIRLDPAQAPKINTFDRYEFQNKDGTSGIVLAPDFISLHTSQYDTGENFEQVLKTALDVAHEIVKFNLVERVGLRYIDLIRLGKNETWSEYIQPTLLGLDPEKLGVSKSLSRFEFVGITEVGTLVVRYSQSDQGIILPLDLIPSTLKHDVQLNASELVAFLDIDHFSEQSRDFDVSAVMEIVSDLHDTTTRAFRNAVTETALIRWGREAAK
jgi:uncharacterized protein (TIGR04255 family)